MISWINFLILLGPILKGIYDQFMARWVAIELLIKDKYWLRRKGKISKAWVEDSTGCYNLEQFRKEFTGTIRKILEQETTVIRRDPLLNIGMSDDQPLNQKYTTFFKVLDPDFKKIDHTQILKLTKTIKIMRLNLIHS